MKQKQELSLRVNAQPVDQFMVLVRAEENRENSWQFPDMTLKVQITKAKIDKLDYIK